MLFGSGRIVDRLDEIAALGRTDGPWVVIDGYHAFMAIDCPFGFQPSKSAFYLGGGYKYAMAGEGSAFLHAPTGFGPRPPVTGWFAEFRRSQPLLEAVLDMRAMRAASLEPRLIPRASIASLECSECSSPTNSRRRGFRNMRPAFNKPSLNGDCRQPAVASGTAEPPRWARSHARFLALFRSRHAERWFKELKASVTAQPTCVRAFLRIGFAIYQDESDVRNVSRDWCEDLS